MSPDLQSRIEALVPKLEGWCTVEKALAMAQLILDAGPGHRLCVEIGVHGVTPDNSTNVTLRFGDPTAAADFALADPEPDPGELTTDILI